VDKDSATLGLPGSREIQIPMDADHVGICKFASIDGSDYKQVASNLVELASYAVKTARDKTRRIQGSPCKSMLMSSENVHKDHTRVVWLTLAYAWCSCSVGGGPAMLACSTVY
jgi:hypothetical protein